MCRQGMAGSRGQHPDVGVGRDQIVPQDAKEVKRPGESLAGGPLDPGPVEGLARVIRGGRGQPAQGRGGDAELVPKLPRRFGAVEQRPVVGEGQLIDELLRQPRGGWLITAESPQPDQGRTQPHRDRRRLLVTHVDGGLEIVAAAAGDREDVTAGREQQ